MANILQIETATQVCSVALSVNGKTKFFRELQGQNLHASNLTILIQEVVQEAGIDYSDLNAIAVSKGPGSYTGLRIGVSTVKGLCFALDKPLLAIETLKMLAAGFLEQNPTFNGLICPMIDARRMEVYTALFDTNLNVVEETSAKIIDENSFIHELETTKIVFIGDGASKCSGTITSFNAIFNSENYNSAKNMSELSFQAYMSNNFEDVAYFEPFYLKDFVVTQPKKKV